MVWHAVVCEVLPSGPKTVAVQTNRLSSDVGLAEHPAGTSAISFACKVWLSVPDSLKLRCSTYLLVALARSILSQIAV